VFGVLFCEETFYELVQLFVKILTRTREIRYCLQKLIFFEMFLKLFWPLDWSFTILKMAALSWRFVQVTIARNTAVIRRGLHEGRILAGYFGCFVNFLVMFWYIWVYFWVYLERFCKGLVKSMEIKKN